MTQLAGDRALGSAGPIPRVSSRRRLGWGDRLVLVVATAFALFLGLPVAVLIVRSIATGALAEAASSTVVLDALALSLVTTSTSLVLTVLIGLPLAFVLARRTFRGRWLVEGIVDLPIVLPPSVAGLALLLVFGRRGGLGEAMTGRGIVSAVSSRAGSLARSGWRSTSG